jgi:hypothetical protein
MLVLLLVLLSLFAMPLAEAAGVPSTVTGTRATDLVLSAGMVIERARGYTDGTWPLDGRPPPTSPGRAPRRAAGRASTRSRCMPALW